MCRLCAGGRDDRALAQRVHVLQLLALIEHPDALHADAALRLGQEILSLIRSQPGLRRCDPVTPPASSAEQTS